MALPETQSSPFLPTTSPATATTTNGRYEASKPIGYTSLLPLPMTGTKPYRLHVAETDPRRSRRSVIQLMATVVRALFTWQVASSKLDTGRPDVYRLKQRLLVQS